MFIGVAAIAVLIPLISVVGFPTMNAKPSSHSSSGDICKQNALKYEQLGYYKGGGAQFNAVMATCAVGQQLMITHRNMGFPPLILLIT